MEFKNRLLDGELISLFSGDDMISLFLGRQGVFCLELNAKVILATKTWKPIQNKLNTFIELIEE